ncbi:leucyl-tRNA synthetase [Nonlabens dokdonensis]|uniref:Leucine--tRNA ligase n=2 Tax=Nonlabens dokdonensis TaxID=328515 RepID=L7W516_NONDD|nr:class I tRNA ligase family protein [Nonlabens dokdonensis]AGC76730.1 leucyl-tRNA synthetase [Nonlabens dokdonensis DSW-6]PZX44377.1 leucyl-tRNA synthetase [Nonlabens dokdonensis]
MLLYDHKEIEAKWQKHWAENKTFKAVNNSDKPKFYALDMFPYPSGAGLHVGHPLGYIASDIVSRYKRHTGHNVLHPMGYDSFGLPAEQYAIQTGQHPAITTKENIARYREQMDRIGFSFDWDREVRTSSPDYYKYTQEIFIMLFESWYDKDADKAQPISLLESRFRESGTSTINAATDEDLRQFTAAEWNAFTDKEQQEILLDYRLTFLADTEVNWCPALGTVLANDEIVNGVSERGGHPVVRKKMRQWMMRISAFAERLLNDLDGLDWSESIKEIQRNWIGKSVGALVEFRIQNSEFRIPVFTTRPDTIYGVTFMTLAPEHELVDQITTPEQKEAVEAYKKATAARSERERMADVKTISGVFTGAYATHPLSGEPVPVWIGDYVLAGYGTGAVMAVPCGDERDHAFANFFADQEGMPEIKNIFEGVDISAEAYVAKDKTPLCNSDFLNGMSYQTGAMAAAIEKLEAVGAGKGKTNYRLRDAVFSRQRYWGEPFPVYYKDGLPQMIDRKHLPIELPEVDEYLPTEDGAPPLGRATTWSWCTQENKVVSNEDERDCVFPLELNTMPGWAGSSWYMFRYMDANNEDEMFSAAAQEYWNNVDLYIGGSEHATGHLLYSRFWVKLLHDLGKVTVKEPFQKMINQGMILGESAFAYSMSIDIIYSPNTREGSYEFEALVSHSMGEFYIKHYNLFKDSIWADKVIFERNFNTLCDLDKRKFRHFDEQIRSQIPKGLPGYNLTFSTRRVHIPIDKVKNACIIEDRVQDVKDLTKTYLEIRNLDNDFDTSHEPEKMSKSKYNVVNPDDICDQYGADTLRLYEMFLGPLEQAKPWNTAGITGVYGFMKKLWKLYHDENGFAVSDEKASPDSMKTLHKTIKKVQDDIENFSFNTSVSSFMIAVNELTTQKCNSRAVLEPLAVLVSPYAPHIAEELWSLLGHNESISDAPFPVFDEKHLVESSKTYPISFNGKMKFTLDLPVDISKNELEKMVLDNEKVQQQLEGKQIRKTIIVPGKIVNFVVG